MEGATAEAAPPGADVSDAPVAEPILPAKTAEDAEKGEGGVMTPRAKKIMRENMAMLALVLIGVLVQITQKSSLKGESKYEYNTYTVIAMAELIKLCMSSVMHFHSKPEKFIPDVPWSFIGTYTALAFMYCVNNQLTFALLAWMGPGQMTLAKSFSPVVAAYLLWTLYGEIIGYQRMGALAIAALGLTFLFYDPDKGLEVRTSQLFFLYVAMAVAGTCAVVNSKALQGDGKPPLHFQNMLLYSQGLFFNLILLTGQLYSSDRTLLDAFDGFGPFAWVIILLHSLNGIAITLVLKYGGAVEKSLTAGVTAVLLLITDFLLFGAEPTFFKVVGGIIAAGAIYGYKKLKNPTQSDEDISPASLRSTIGVVVVGLSAIWGIYAIAAELKGADGDGDGGDGDGLVSNYMQYSAQMTNEHQYYQFSFMSELDNVYAQTESTTSASSLGQVASGVEILGCDCCSDCCLPSNPLEPPSVTSGCNCCAQSTCPGEWPSCPLGAAAAAAAAEPDANAEPQHDKAIVQDSTADTDANTAATAAAEAEEAALGAPLQTATAHANDEMVVPQKQGVSTSPLTTKDADNALQPVQLLQAPGIAEAF